jgi:hypothetical protein
MSPDDDDLFDDDDTSDLAEEWRWTRELNRLLADTGLAPDTRARCIAALISLRAARMMQAAVERLDGDVVPLLTDGLRERR